MKTEIKSDLSRDASGYNKIKNKKMNPSILIQLQNDFQFEQWLVFFGLSSPVTATMRKIASGDEQPVLGGGGQSEAKWSQLPSCCSCYGPLWTHCGWNESGLVHIISCTQLHCWGKAGFSDCFCMPGLCRILVSTTAGRSLLTSDLRVGAEFQLQSRRVQTASTQNNS